MKALELALKNQLENYRAIPVMLTVELATELKTLNTHNRKIKPAVVEKYNLDAASGNWEMTASGIGVSSTGQLLDGQHRIEVVLATKRAIPIVIVFGLAPVSQMKVDRHAKRSNLDVFSLAGLTHDPVAIQCAVYFAKLSGNGLSGRNTSPPDNEVISAFQNHEPYISKASAWSGRMKGYSRIGVIAGLVCYMEVDEEKAEKFGARVKDGSGMTKDDPAFKLREWIHHGIAGSGSGGSLFQDECFRRTLYAAQADYAGRRINCLRETTTSEFSK